MAAKTVILKCCGCNSEGREVSLVVGVLKTLRLFVVFYLSGTFQQLS
jgi:hypothetical protein